MSDHHPFEKLRRPIREDPVRWARVQKGRRLYDKLEIYYHLSYTVEAKRTSEGYFAKVIELPGCMTWAESFEELEAMIEDALITWLWDALKDDDTIPKPQDASNHRGIQVRGVKRPGKSLDGNSLDLEIGEETTWIRDPSQEHTT